MRTLMGISIGRLVGFVLEISRLLNQRSFEILELRLWKNKTLREVGAIYGISHQRVRQIEITSLVKLQQFYGVELKWKD